MIMIKNKNNDNYNNHNNNNSHNIKLKLKILPTLQKMHIYCKMCNKHTSNTFPKKLNQRKIKMCYLFH